MLAGQHPPTCMQPDVLAACMQSCLGDAGYIWAACVQAGTKPRFVLQPQGVGGLHRPCAPHFNTGALSHPAQTIQLTAAWVEWLASLSLLGFALGCAVREPSHTSDRGVQHCVQR